jgi:O-antigen ligase
MTLRSILNNICHAKATDRAIGITLAFCLFALIACKFVLAVHAPSLLIPSYIFVFGLISVISFQKPFWGIAVIAFGLPVELLIPSISFATSLYPIIGAATLCGYLLHVLLVKRVRPVFTWTHVLGALFVLWFSLSNPNAAFVLGNRVWFFTFIQLLVFMWLTTQLVNTREQEKRLLLAFAIASVVSALFAIPQVTYGMDSATSIRATGLTGHPNGAARIYVLAIVFLAYFVFSEKRRSWQYPSLIGLGILFAALAATVSRTGLLLLLTAGGSILVFPGHQLKRKKIEVLSSLLLGALLVVPSDYWRIAAGILPSIVTGTDSVGFRYMQWEAGFQMWRDHFLSGVGVGQFQTTIPFYGTQFTPFYGLGYVSHNFILALLAETGIIGALLFVGVFCATMLALIQAIGTTSIENKLPLYMWLTALIIILLGGSTADTHFDKMLWFLLGIKGIKIEGFLYRRLNLAEIRG